MARGVGGAHFEAVSAMAAKPAAREAARRSRPSDQFPLTGRPLVHPVGDGATGAGPAERDRRPGALDELQRGTWLRRARVGDPVAVLLAAVPGVGAPGVGAGLAGVPGAAAVRAALIAAVVTAAAVGAATAAVVLAAARVRIGEGDDRLGGGRRRTRPD